jgi:Ca2+-binding RTX toxin-like protein
MNGDSASYQSKLINNGTIKTDATYAFAPAVSHEGIEDFRLVNNGLIKAPITSFSGASVSGDQTVVNNGKMVGEVQLGSGDDVYNGQKGIITNGTVWAGDGDDRLIGGDTTDILIGSTGHDILTGGKGADHFVYQLIADSLVAGSSRDLITDFSHSQHDRIDLGGIDAIANNANTNDRFSFIGTRAFDGHAGELHFFSTDGDTFAAADVDGDKHADFEIELSGIISLHGSDFIL